jgi:hypothetical protein
LQGKVLSNVRKVYFLLNLSVATVAPVANKRTVAIGCPVVVSKVSRLGQVHVRVTGVFLFHILDCQNMSEHVRTYWTISETATWSVPNNTEYVKQKNNKKLT